MGVWKRIYSFTVPMVGRGEAQDAMAQRIKETEAQAVKKPDNMLGAVHIDNYVQQRRNVVLCEQCWRKYGTEWVKRYGYRADWVGWLTNCDGCKRFVRCNGFYPEETISKVLHERYWHDDYKPK